MKTWVRRSLNVGVLGAGFLLVGGTAAQADMVSGPNAGIASGNQLSSVLQVPVDVSGNAVSVLGFANAQSVGGAGAVNTESATTESAASTEAGMVTGFNGGVLSGNQVSNVVQVPVSVCGNSIAVLGFANASCVGGAGAVNGGGSGGWDRGGWDRDRDRDWDDDDNGQGAGGYGGGRGAGSGYGDADANDYGQGRSRSYGGGNSASHDDYNEHSRRRHGGGSGALSNGSADMVTGYNAGIGSGNQVSNVIQVPVDISGNAISVLGFANARSVGGAGAVNESASATESGMVSGFNAGILTGNQVSNVVQVPVSVCGNSIAVLGFANASCVGGAAAVNGGGAGGGWDRDRDRDWDDDDNGQGAGGYGGQGAGNYGGGQGSGGRPSAYDPATNAAAHKAAKKAAKKAKKNEHSNAGARGMHRGPKWNHGHDWDGNGSGSGRGNSNGYGGGASAGDDDDDRGWDRNRGRGWDRDGGSCGNDMVTGYNAGILSGNQFSSVVQVPVDISGNAISLLGFANARSVGGAAAVNC